MQIWFPDDSSMQEEPLVPEASWFLFCVAYQAELPEATSLSYQKLAVDLRQDQRT